MSPSYIPGTVTVTHSYLISPYEDYKVDIDITSILQMKKLRLGHKAIRQVVGANGRAADHYIAKIQGEEDPQILQLAPKDKIGLLRHKA